MLLGGAVLGVALAGPARSAEAAVVPGTAQALATALTVGPATGGLSEELTFGQSLAAYLPGEAQAQAQAVNFGSIGLSLTSDQCNGSPPLVQPSQLPKPATAESIDQPQSQTVDAAPIPGSAGVGVGVQQAATTPEPAGTATTTLAAFSVPGVLQVGSGVASAHVAFVGGDVRQATASVQLSSLSLLGGLVVLDGLEWTVEQESGASQLATGSFHLGGVQVAGVPLPNPPALPASDLLGPVDQALGPTGLGVQWPTTQVDQAQGTVQETPLVVQLSNSALGRQLVGPLLGPSETVRDAIQQALLGVSCTFGTELTLGDIGIGILAGAGSLTLAFGGVQAGTTDQVATNPFAVDLGGTSGFGATSTAGEGPGGGPAAGLLGGGGTGGLGSGGAAGVPATGSAGAAGAASGPASALRVTSTVACQSLAGGRCGTDHALPAALGALGVLGVVAGWDLVRLRRRPGLRGG